MRVPGHGLVNQIIAIIAIMATVLPCGVTMCLLFLAQVLHIRNLPYETTDEELRELAAPFGQLVQTKLNVGTNRNQAFIEFPDMQQAINMASYFQNSAEPAKVSAGHTMVRCSRMQWSQRRPATNSETAAGQTGSASGAAFLIQVLLEYSVSRSQATVCSQVRGKTVYLQYSTRNEIVNAGGGGGERPSNCLLVTLENLDVRILFSLPFCSATLCGWSDSFLMLIAMAQGLQLQHHSPPHIPACELTKARGLRVQPSVVITIDVLHLVFSAFGYVCKIATFEKQAGFQALIQYPDPATAETVR